MTSFDHERLNNDEQECCATLLRPLHRVFSSFFYFEIVLVPIFFIELFSMFGVIFCRGPPGEHPLFVPSERAFNAIKLYFFKERVFGTSYVPHTSLERDEIADRQIDVS